MIVFLLAMTFSAGAKAGVYQASGEHCYCAELERRLSGFRLAITHLYMSSYEQSNLQNQIDMGANSFRQAMTMQPYSDAQAGACTQGNRDIANAWNRWQPELAQNRLDYEYSCR